MTRNPDSLLGRNSVALVLALLGCIAVTMGGGIALSAHLQAVGQQGWADAALVLSFVALAAGLFAIGRRAGG